MKAHIPLPPLEAAAALPTGFRLLLTARHHAGGLLESSLRPAIARLRLPEGTLPADGHLQVDGPADAVLGRRLMDLDLAVPGPDEEASGPPVGQLTVVVPVRDRAGDVDRLLRGLLEATSAEPRPRVLVVNDASRDTAALEAVTARHGVPRVDLPVNVGPAGARNAGLRQVTTPFVAFVDSDVTVTRAQVARLLREFTDPLLAVAAPRVRARGPVDGTSGGPLVAYEHLVPPLDLGRLPGLVGPSRRLTYVPSACWVARTAALGEGFTEALRVGEDVDLAWRLADAGWLVRYVPAVTVGHATRQRVGGWLRQHAGYGLSSAALSQRHPGRLAPARYNATGWAVALSMSAPWPVFAITCLTAFCLSWLRLRRRLDRSPTSGAVAARLAWSGIRANLLQTASLACRYGFPVALPWALVHRPPRRLLGRAVVLDALAVTLRRSAVPPPATGGEPVYRAGHPVAPAGPTGLLPVLRAALVLLPGRVGENSAFACGVLAGCLRHRTLEPLTPARVGSRRPRRLRHTAGEDPQVRRARGAIARVAHRVKYLST